MILPSTISHIHKLFVFFIFFTGNLLTFIGIIGNINYVVGVEFCLGRRG